MKTTNGIYEFTPRYATIELTGFTPEEVEKLRDKRVTIVLRDVCLEGAEYNFILPSLTEIKLEFCGIKDYEWEIINEKNSIKSEYIQ